MILTFTLALSTSLTTCALTWCLIIIRRWCLIIVSIFTRKAILLKNNIVDDVNNSVLRSGIRTNNFRHVTFATSITVTLLVNCSRFFTIFRLGIITLWWTLTKATCCFSPLTTFTAVCHIQKIATNKVFRANWFKSYHNVIQ